MFNKATIIKVLTVKYQQYEDFGRGMHLQRSFRNYAKDRNSASRRVEVLPSLQELYKIIPRGKIIIHINAIIMYKTVIIYTLDTGIMPLQPLATLVVLLAEARANLISNA